MFFISWISKHSCLVHCLLRISKDTGHAIYNIYLKLQLAKKQNKTKNKNKNKTKQNKKKKEKKKKEKKKKPG